MSQIRLDKWLADAGVGTRSQVKEYLKKGRVRVNGEPVKKPETRISEETDEVSFDGEILSRPGLAWYMFHKPAGCITAARNGRTETVMDYFAEAPEKELAPVGRLDKDTEGFLLITNDGPLNHFLLAPGRHVEKTYYAKAEGTLFPEAKAFSGGLDMGTTSPPSRKTGDFKAGGERGRASPDFKRRPFPSGETDGGGPRERKSLTWKRISFEGFRWTGLWKKEGTVL